MEYHEFNCKHCDHRTYYKEAMVRHVAEKHGDTARAADQARIRELREAIPVTPEQIRDFIGPHFNYIDFKLDGEVPSIEDTYNLSAHDLLSAFDRLLDRPANYSALNEALAAECEWLADNVTLLVGIHASPQERYRLRDSLRERAAAHRAKGKL